MDRMAIGAQASLRCYPDYKLTGSPLITCEQNGWSSVAASCTPRPVPQCGNIPKIDNGTFTVLEDGRSACLACDADYTMAGYVLPGILCNNSGKWTETSTSCIKRPVFDCGTPTEIVANGKFEVLQNGLAAALVCNTGYKWDGMDHPGIVCLKNGSTVGTWTTTTAMCVAPLGCGPPLQTVSNGEFKVLADKLSAILVCVPGYTVTGPVPVFITCILNGPNTAWTETPESCEKCMDDPQTGSSCTCECTKDDHDNVRLTTRPGSGCNEFLQCAPHTATTYCWVTMICPEGTLFDETLNEVGVCNHAGNVQCDDTCPASCPTTDCPSHCKCGPD